MMPSTMSGPAGIVVTVLAAVVVAIMAIIHRRGGARVAGIIGVVFVIGGILAPHAIDLFGIGQVGMSTEAIPKFIVGAAPGVLTGGGIILICIAALSLRTVPKTPRPSRSE
ncbi:hypothetical protein [Brevibacterium aurantiacum]|uniref:Uncharacterized protein n=1 Tax=Brevibacterium aurantiacum TaxID=273384 RepID=A0A2A3ZK06_BREAU|nr:hypothetical protein [Brevibacterium aurantiacum]AZL08032.1 hypothetical protein CXR26_01355 [Brevibacterium aurantiacum]PCC52000.1 hypothetical protein CIK62_00785 [Brevibacterium aurantiacum]GEB24217.1 hypothetical protein BAU01nite_29500 [Brevibacterium aurantiacum]SMX92567.1 hypothetical protein BAUR9175_02939 [Brevibacterium aurantiacum]